MKNSKFITMGIVSSLLFSASSNAQVRHNNSANEQLTTTVTDITGQNPGDGVDLIPPANQGTLPGLFPGGTACDQLTDPTCILPDPITPGIPSGGFDLSTILTVGQKIWDFIVTNKPTAEYKTLRASVLPGGATNWAQLKGWSKPVAKVYHVGFKNLFGKDAGGFDYRIVFIHGGNYQGKGKYIGQISFTPANIKLVTDRALHVQAELLDALNFGTEENPIAGVQLLITWSSNTTLRYNMNSIEYFLYGTGEIQDISNGTL